MITSVSVRERHFHVKARSCVEKINFENQMEQAEMIVESISEYYFYLIILFHYFLFEEKEMLPFFIFNTVYYLSLSHRGCFILMTIFGFLNIFSVSLNILLCVNIILQNLFLL